MGHSQSTVSIENDYMIKKKAGLIKSIRKRPVLYIMLIPGFLYFLIFKYVPMWGLLIAFKDYSPFLGFFESKWIGFVNFQRFFTQGDFQVLLINTLWLAVLNIIFYFPIPIILALLLNEIRRETFKKTIQTLIYIPHFLSWVVIISLCYVFLNADSGVVNLIIKNTGHNPISFLTSVKLFRPMVTAEIIWKESGWGTIIFLASLSGVDIALYEAATIDGANRWQQLWNVTIPAIRSTIVILLILRMGSFLDTGFEQLILMINSLNRNVGEVFDTYVYSNGIQQAKFSYTTAVGMFKSVVGFILIFGANRIANKLGEEGIF